MSSTTNNLQNWLRKPEAPTRARLIVEARRDAQARRFLPGGAAARRLAATTVLDVLQLALEGVEAAQVIVPFLPRVLFAKSATLSEQVAAMVAEEWHDTPRRDVQRPDPTALWVSRVRGSIDSNDLRALNRLLVDGVTTGAASQTQSSHSKRKGSWSVVYAASKHFSTSGGRCVVEQMLQSSKALL